MQPQGFTDDSPTLVFVSDQVKIMTEKVSFLQGAFTPLVVPFKSGRSTTTYTQN